MNCVRCRLPITDCVVKVQKTVAPPAPRTYWLDGDTLARVSYYHQKCLPPNLFHAMARSHLAGQSPAGTSLGNEHAASGGMAHNKKRKRLPRRIRYKRTNEREAMADRARKERQEQYTNSMKIEDTLNRGGKPKLCTCDTFTDRASNTYGMLTTHGYCRYCGGWRHEVFLSACGEAALRQAISELSLHEREKMIAACKLSAS
jgi:hypothetical protein